MNKVRASAPQLEGLVPYDPKYLPAEAYLSANENPRDVDAEVRAAIARRIAQVPLNRYPDPLANRLRDLIAEANGLDRANVLLGNGGDELLFDVALAWGGPGRSFLNLPPDLLGVCGQRTAHEHPLRGCAASGRLLHRRSGGA